MNNIHSTAIIGPEVELGDNVTIHPYALLDGKIKIADGCVVGPYTHLTGWVTIGEGTKIYSGACIGEDPQDYSYDGSKGLVEIGKNCLIREHVTIHTPVHGAEGEKTIVGDGAFLMANSHMAHNTKLGANSVIANGCLMAGYVIIEENAFVSGNVGIHQHCRVGAYSIVGAVSKIAQDVPPFVMSDGNPLLFHGLNVVGLRRRNINQEDRNIIKAVYKILYGGAGMRDAVAEIEATYPENSYAKRIAEFVRASKRGIISCHAE